MKISLSREAQADLQEATDWYLKARAFIVTTDIAYEFEHSCGRLVGISRRT